MEIHCKVESSSVVSFIWLKNHYVIHENISNFNDASILTIELKSENDFGNYTCSAYNEIGELKQVYEVIEADFSSIESEEKEAENSSGVFHLPSAFLIIMCLWCGKLE